MPLNSHRSLTSFLRKRCQKAAKRPLNAPHALCFHCGASGDVLQRCRLCERSFLPADTEAECGDCLLDRAAREDAQRTTTGRPLGEGHPPRVG